jgi:hypothetical protein
VKIRSTAQKRSKKNDRAPSRGLHQKRWPWKTSFAWEDHCMTTKWNGCRRAAALCLAKGGRLRYVFPFNGA